MSVARHPRPPELVDVPIEEIMQKYVGRFREKKPDWAAFEDAKIEGYKRAQHRFIGAGGSGKHGDPSVIPAKNFTLSIMYVEPGQGNAAHVTVDPKLGHVELIDYVVVADCGRIINPLTVNGQTVGSVVQGLGGAMMEHLVYDEHGQLLTGSLADYLIPTASDFPSIRAVMLEHHPSPINPLGAKGAGEGGIIAAGGVMANAVANALSSLGVEPRELPLTPSRIWELAQAARK